MRLLEFKVKNPHDRLDSYLKEQLGQFLKQQTSLGSCKNLIEGGFVYLNQKPCKICSKPVIKGAKVRVYYDHKSPLEPKLTISKTNIVHEDDDIIVINKPSMLASQSTMNKHESSLYDELRYLLQTKNRSFYTYLGLLHRIDKPTSGLILFSKSKWVNTPLTKALEQSSIDKTYLAITPKTERDAPRWEVKDQLIRKKDPKRGMVTTDCETGGKIAHTSFQIIKSNPTHDLIQAVLHTGRTHQVRYHLMKSHAAITGDTLYGSKERNYRCLLHAHKLSFKHPATKKMLSLEAKVPSDMLSILETE